MDGCIINIPLARRVFIEALKTASDRGGIVIRSMVLTIHTFSSARTSVTVVSPSYNDSEWFAISIIAFAYCRNSIPSTA
jgi:hypothetical protein